MNSTVVAGSSPSTPSGPTSTGESTSSSVNVVPIAVGASVGGVGLLVGLIALVWACRKRRSRENDPWQDRDPGPVDLLPPMAESPRPTSYAASYLSSEAFDPYNQSAPGQMYYDRKSVPIGVGTSRSPDGNVRALSYSTQSDAASAISGAGPSGYNSLPQQANSLVTHVGPSSSAAIDKSQEHTEDVRSEPEVPPPPYRGL